MPFNLGVSGMLEQLGPKLIQLMTAQHYAFCLIVLPEFQITGGKVSYLTNIQKDQLIALLKEQITKLEA